MGSQGFNCVSISNNGWVQGSCMVVEKESAFFDKSNNPLKKGLYIVTSQDCDVVNEDLEKEPFVELLYVNEITTIDGSLTYGKNPRKLHFILKDEKKVECIIHDKVYLPRQVLSEISPSADIAVIDENLKILIQWLAGRYIRAAFPDAFNQRLRAHINNIKSVLKQKGGKSYGMFIRLNTHNELDLSENYKILLYVLHAPKYSEPHHIDELDQCLEGVVDIINQAQGVEVIQSQRLSIEDISHYEYIQLRKWDFDSLSYNTNNADRSVLS